MIKEEHEVTFMGGPQNPGPVRSTVVHVQADTAVPDHIVWSLFNTLFFNTCCLGFVAFAYSVKSRDRKMVGDVIGAQSHGSTAKCLNIVAAVLGILMTIGLIVLVATVLPGVIHAVQQNSYGGGF
ncbi:interferon-induced transmembrane protein 3-like [Eptesicus fuscus]|uniref:interferon-induced transmembrane protein 3-like n=1 Tax=Eptesicus fuscus TaxID=29078 RepID=UPI00240401B4|nr:interferon-induced transmembrane protein 3-like [Eptesicus fuscus]